MNVYNLDKSDFTIMDSLSNGCFIVRYNDNHYYAYPSVINKDEYILDDLSEVKVLYIVDHILARILYYNRELRLNQILE